MSVLGLTKLARDLEHVDGLLDDFRAEPARFLERYDLADAEEKAVVDLDTAFLLERGMNPVALRNLIVLLGVPHGQMYTHQHPSLVAQDNRG